MSFYFYFLCKLLQRNPLGRCEEHASLSTFSCTPHVGYEGNRGAEQDLSTFGCLISTISGDVPSGNAACDEEAYKAEEHSANESLLVVITVDFSCVI